MSNQRTPDESVASSGRTPILQDAAEAAKTVNRNTKHKHIKYTRRDTRKYGLGDNESSDGIKKHTRSTAKLRTKYSVAMLAKVTVMYLVF